MKILAVLCAVGLASLAFAQASTGIGAATPVSPRAVLDLPAGAPFALGSCVIATPCPYGPCVLLTPCPASVQPGTPPVQAVQQPAPPAQTVQQPAQPGPATPPQWLIPVIVQVPEARCIACPCPAPAVAPKKK